MAKKRTTLNFFQLVAQNPDAHDSSEIKEHLIKLRDKTLEPMTTRGGVVLMDAPFEYRNSYLLGSVFYVQMKNIPPSLDTATKVISGLDLNPSSGLAKATSFLIDPVANILVIESSTGVSERMICSYLAYNTEIPGITADVIIDPGQIRDFYNMDRVLTFETKIARIQNGSIFEDQNSSIQQITRSADRTNNDKLTYKIEVSNGEGKSLNKSLLTNIVDRFTKYQDTEEVEELFIKGVDSDGSINTIELIKQRMIETIEYDMEDRIIQSFNIGLRQELIEEKYNKHRDSLVVTYSLKR